MWMSDFLSEVLLPDDEHPIFVCFLENGENVILLVDGFFVC